MSTDWTSVILLAAEIPFAVLFLRALLSYLSGRDPLQRDVLLVFTPCAVLFTVDLANQFTST